MAIITDGTGTSGYSGKVDGNNRFHTRSVTSQENQSATKSGRSFNVNTGEITLTDANETPVLYLKNNEDEDLIITAIAGGLGPTTGGSGGIPKIIIEKNPTAGTIVSGATAVDIKSNRNFTSPKELTADAYKGATGLTMTGGSDHLLIYQTSNGRLFAGIDEVLPKGASIGVKFTPQSGNTSQTIYIALICHIQDDKES